LHSSRHVTHLSMHITKHIEIHTHKYTCSHQDEHLHLAVTKHITAGVCFRQHIRALQHVLPNTGSRANNRRDYRCCNVPSFHARGPVHCASCDWSNWQGVGPVYVGIYLACYRGVSRQTAEKWRDFDAQGMNVCVPLWFGSGCVYVDMRVASEEGRVSPAKWC
jgi:hypothetical protein